MIIFTIYCVENMIFILLGNGEIKWKIEKQIWYEATTV